LIKGEVFDDTKTLDEFSRDAGFFKVDPSIVVAPKDVEDIKNLVKFVSENKAKNPSLSLTVRAGGSDMSGGPINESIIIDVIKYLNNFGGMAGDSAIAEPGMYYKDFEKETLKQGLIFPSFPASRELCAIGGIVANNAGGEKSLAYGKTQDYVESVKMVLSDGNEYVFGPLNKKGLGEKMRLNTLEGEVYKKVNQLILNNENIIKDAKPDVSKNSAGYFLWDVWDREKEVFNLAKLIVGSQGTLGIITEATLGLIRPKKHSRMLVIFLRSTKPLASIISKILTHKPETLESYDNHTLKLAMCFLPQFVKILKSDIISLGFSFLPEAKMILTGGFPKIVLMTEFTGDDEKEVILRAKKAEESLRGLKIKTRVTKTEQESNKYRTIRRESFNLLREKIRDKQTAPFMDDVIVKPDKLSEFLPKIESILSEYPDLVYTISGHAGNGNFHIIPLMDLDDPRSKEIIKKLTPRIHELAISFGGSITAEHNDGIIRTPFLKDMYGEEVYNLFEQVKDIFDPQNIFNPGKKVPSTSSGQGIGTFEYALEHIKAK
jgi:FAD/FMN-containing dehydrogenase